jgi:hypothetical protein
MRTSQNTSTVLLAVLVAIVLAALDWFFFLSPSMGAASDARAANDAQVLKNADLTIQLQKRKADSEHLPESKAEVWAIRDQMPPVLDTAGVRDEIEALGANYGLVVQSDLLGSATEVIPGLVLADAFAPYGMESYVDTLTFTGLSSAPFSLGVQGNFSTVLTFLDALQMGDHRYFLISSLSLTGVAEDLAAVPPTHAGDVQVSVSGYFFVLDHGVEGITQRPAADPMPGSVPLPGEVEPAPSSDRNFVLP